MGDLDKSGNMYQQTRVYLGPSLGWTSVRVRPETWVTTGGTTTLVPDVSVVLVDVAATVTLNLPDVVSWMKQTALYPSTAFERSIFIKDFGHNALGFPITIHPFGGQSIDDGASNYSLAQAGQMVRLYAMNDLSGWYMESNINLNAGLGVVDWINAEDFGASPSNPDNTAAIQAAIDFAYANNINVTYIPSGNYPCGSTIYLDPPLNLRVSWVAPTIFNFSMTLMGDPILPNHEGDGTILAFTTNAIVGVAMGTGQGMCLKDMIVLGPNTGLTRGQQNSAGVGVGLAGGPGGMTRSRLDNVYARNWYTGFKTGVNGYNALCDSNTFIKCLTGNCKYGLNLSQTQNFINTLLDCQFDAQYSVYSPVGVNTIVEGGNYSTSGVVWAYDITAVSAVTATGNGNSFIYTFTAHLTTPDSWWTLGANGPIFNIASFETVHFGVVTCNITGYNSGTQVISFQIYPQWGFFNFGGTNAVTSSELQTELQACAIVFVAEQATTFTGNNFDVSGVHIENPNTPTVLVDGSVGFGSSDRPNWFKNIFCNFDPTESNLSGSGTPGVRARYMCGANHFPFITCTSGTGTGSDIHISETKFGNVIPVMIDNPGASLTIENIGDCYINLRTANNSNILDAASIARAYFTAGIFNDQDHFFVFTSADSWRRRGWGFAPNWGYRPAPWTTPNVQSGEMATLSGSLPTIGTYSILWGGQLYRELPSYANITPTPPREFWSDHSFYSYGQNLPVSNWTYKGGSSQVYASDMTYIFPGLGIILDNGSGDVKYLVTATFPSLGYFTVAHAASLTNIGQLVGLKTTVFAGATIKQDPYIIRTAAPVTSPVVKTADFTVAATEDWLINNKAAATCTVTLPAAGSYPGRTINMTNYQAFTVVSASSNVVPQIGGGAGTAILPATSGKWVALVSNGTNWVITQSG